MLNTSNTTPFTMPVAPAYANGGGFGFGNDSVIWLFFILAVIGGWGFGGTGFGGFGGYGGAAENYVLASDFATLQRMISDGDSMIERKLDGLNNGICSLGYDQLAQMNGINTNIMQSANAIQGQLAQCCCDNREAIAGLNYNLATQVNGLNSTISNGFCQTNFNNSNNTRDIMDSQNAGTQAILAKLSQMESNAKDEKIAELTAKNSDLRLAASQSAQNSYLIGQLRPAPVPAYTVANPFCNCGQVYGGYFNGTTIV